MKVIEMDNVFKKKRDRLQRRLIPCMVASSFFPIAIGICYKGLIIDKFIIFLLLESITIYLLYLSYLNINAGLLKSEKHFLAIEMLKNIKKKLSAVKDPNKIFNEISSSFIENPQMLADTYNYLSYLLKFDHNEENKNLIMVIIIGCRDYIEKMPKQSKEKFLKSRIPAIPAKKTIR